LNLITGLIKPGSNKSRLQLPDQAPVHEVLQTNSLGYL
jgi:hypothetical protein